MTNARDKANIPVLNFQSKGIDDNADATAITINSSENVLINTTSASGFDAGGLPLLVGNGSTHQGLTIYTGTSHTGAIHFADGTGAGSYRGQINYRHDTDALQIAVAGSEKIRLTSTGLGIGTSSPLRDLVVSNSGAEGYEFGPGETSDINQTLHYNRSSSAYIAHWQRASYHRFDTPTTEAMRLTSTGLGIGTSAPSSILHAETTTGAELILSRNDTSIAVDDLIGGIQFKANDASSSPDPQICGIKAISTGATNTNPKLNFFAGESNYSANTPNMVIDSSGNVGIGTSSSSSTLHISGNPQVQLTQPNNLVLQNDTDSATSGDAKTGILFRANYSGSTPTDLANITAGKENATNNNYGSFISFHTRTNGVNELREALSISSVRRFHTNGTTSPGGLLNLVGERGANYKAITFEHTSQGGEVGKITTGSSSVSYNTSSDYRLKENVVDMTNATDRLKQLQPKRFNFKVDADTTVDGFLAHEVQNIVPEAISGTKDAVQVWEEGEELPDGVSIGNNKLDENGNTIPEYQGIDQSKIVPLLVKTIQELEARITTLEANNP
jgi:hypothetical protein